MGKNNLRRLKAESSGFGVWILSVLQDQSTVFSQGQIVSSGEVAKAERLAPSNMAAAPAKQTEWMSKAMKCKHYT